MIRIASVLSGAILVLFVSGFSGIVSNADDNKADDNKAEDNQAEDNQAADSAGGPEALFKQLDSSADGQLSKEEAGEQHRRLFERLLRRADANSDGQLTQEEFAAGMIDDKPAAPLGGPGGPAGGPAGGRDAGQFFRRMDTNGDGKVTLDEVPQQARERIGPLLERMDADGDKAVSLDEFQRGQQMAQRFARMAQNRGGPREIERRFKSMDTNGDGKIVLDELPAEGRERFQNLLNRADANSDQAIDLDELKRSLPPDRPEPDGRNEPPQGPGELIFATLDSDGDGGLSAAEIAAAPEALKKLDADGDGAVSRREIATPAMKLIRNGDDDAGRFLNRLRGRDADGDGKLSRDEVPAFLKKNFDRLDSNGDGHADPAELEGAIKFLQEQRRQRPKPGK